MGADPVTMAIIMTAAQTGMDVLASQQQKASEKALAKFNERLARRKAGDTREVASEEQFERRQDLKRVVARNRVLIGKSGVQAAGSPLQAQLQLIDDVAKDIETVGFNAEVEARDLELQADIFDIQRKQASRAGRMALGSSLVSGFGNLMSLQNPKGSNFSISGQKSVLNAPEPRMDTLATGGMRFN